MSNTSLNHESVASTCKCSPAKRIIIDTATSMPNGHSLRHPTSTNYTDLHQSRPLAFCLLCVYPVPERLRKRSVGVGQPILTRNETDAISGYDYAPAVRHFPVAELDEIQSKWRKLETGAIENMGHRVHDWSVERRPCPVPASEADAWRGAH